MNVNDVAKVARQYFKEVLGKEASILSVEQIEKGWKVELETIDYRGAGFDPTLALYEVTIDQGQKVSSYRRTHLRKESQLSWSPAILE